MIFQKIVYQGLFLFAHQLIMNTYIAEGYLGVQIINATVLMLIEESKQLVGGCFEWHDEVLNFLFSIAQYATKIEIMTSNYQTGDHDKKMLLN